MYKKSIISKLSKSLKKKIACSVVWLDSIYHIMFKLKKGTSFLNFQYIYVSFCYKVYGILCGWEEIFIILLYLFPLGIPKAKMHTYNGTRCKMVHQQTTRNCEPLNRMPANPSLQNLSISSHSSISNHISLYLWSLTALLFRAMHCLNTHTHMYNNAIGFLSKNKTKKSQTLWFQFIKFPSTFLSFSLFFFFWV